jgi:hypothetical protein
MLACKSFCTLVCRINILVAAGLCPTVLAQKKDLPVGDNYFTNSRHERHFGHWVSFAEKQQRVGPYFQILAQVIVEYSFLD